LTRSGCTNLLFLKISPKTRAEAVKYFENPRKNFDKRENQ
jgi:hypothetical protein